ncbi:MATE family efflux transporter [Pontibacter sp. SGAir0037]|uniref:MATE family efflux transporter n=1 Tax=Pontibacter sp. SGAir0037 TaxID=2571030 RepID=UPI0010CD60D1|nr:MATE family efflux transporter [Pontibacter sp. SGAir0037]QCR21627.1 MATE family efflux transporter [Pontibacter sp. SGAir0037]
MLSRKAKKILRQIHALALPAMATSITEPVLALTDTAIVGHLGSVEVAAVGIAASFYMLLLWALSALRGAVSSIVAQQAGHEPISKLRQFMLQAVLLALLIGLIVSVITMQFSQEIFRLYGAEGQLLQEAAQYFRIRAWALPLSLGTLTLYGIFRGMQNTSWAMVISLAGALLNVLLDWLLILGIPGAIPALGTEGAAFATVGAQLLVFMLAFACLLRQTKISICCLWHPHSQLRQLHLLSFNLMLRTISLNIAYVLGSRFATHYGTSSLAAYTIGMNLWLFSSFLLDGYASAAAALSGNLKGKKQFRRLYDTMLLTLQSGMGISLMLAVLYLLLYWRMSSFFTQDPEVITLFENSFWVIILCQPLHAIAFILDGALEGAGDTTFLRNSLFITIMMGFVPVLYTLDALHLKLAGIWIAYFVWMLLRAGLLSWGFRSRYRKPDHLAIPASLSSY